MSMPASVNARTHSASAKTVYGMTEPGNGLERTVLGRPAHCQGRDLRDSGGLNLMEMPDGFAASERGPYCYTCRHCI